MAAFVALTGCTAVTVGQLDASSAVQHVCIEENQKVIVGEFLGVVIDGFQARGITTEVYSGARPDHCTHKLTYTALRSWDIATYLSHAELRLFHGDSLIASAEYHLRGGGGFALTKWAGVRSKMDPVIDQLLAQYPPIAKEYGVNPG